MTLQRHDADTDVHITINIQPIQGRKGKGNIPYIFRGRGLIYLHDLLSLDFEGSNEKKRQAALKDDPTFDITKELVQWNSMGAFANYLTREHEAFVELQEISDLVGGLGDFYSRHCF